jgi:hypothetical protein
MPPSPYIVSFILYSSCAQCSVTLFFIFHFFYFHTEGETSRLWMFNYKVFCGSVFFLFLSVWFCIYKRPFPDPVGRIVMLYLGNILLLPSSKYWVTCAIYLIIIAIERYLLFIFHFSTPSLYYCYCTFALCNHINHIICVL